MLLAFGMLALSSASGYAGERAPVPRLLVLGGHLHERVLAGAALSARDKNALLRLPLVLKKQFAPGVTAPDHGPLRFITLAGKLLGPGAAVPPGGIRLLPVAPGVTALRLQAGLIETSVVALDLVSWRARALVKRDRLSISRSLPPELSISESSAEADEEAVALRFTGPTQALPSTVTVTTFSAGDRFVDVQRDLGLVSAPCAVPDMSCATTSMLRLVVDGIERHHPQVSTRSLIAEVGGEMEVRLEDEAQARFVVGAPPGVSDEAAPPGRYKMNIRARLVNMQAGGPPPVGVDEEEAIRIVADEMEVASRVWGQCGIVLGPREEWDVQVVDPPQVTLLEIGCGGAVRASGGSIGLTLGRKRLTLKTHQGETPLLVARRLRQAVEKLGFVGRLYRNAQVVHAALSSYDLMIADTRGDAVRLDGAASPLSSDPTLGVCLGEVDLGDGLDHFTDFNAAAGTLEERVLLRALGDDDPATIELVVVPIFSGVGRIGESFIDSVGGSLRNALILDRGGIRAGARSLTLSHELGHILLEMPGHPDDFGVDTPTSLMDADAADATIFGPRRLSLEECRRALRQSGPMAPEPVLAAWPLD